MLPISSVPPVMVCGAVDWCFDVIGIRDCGWYGDGSLKVLREFSTSAPPAKGTIPQDFLMLLNDVAFTPFAYPHVPDLPRINKVSDALDVVLDSLGLAYEGLEALQCRLAFHIQSLTEMQVRMCLTMEKQRDKAPTMWRYRQQRGLVVLLSQGGDRHMTSTSVNNVDASSSSSRIPGISGESTSRIDSLSEQLGRSGN
ncbi:hypothetical protein Tco_1276430 [Tanacetum coccineum]